MVVAEVPLWVVHSNANTPAAKKGASDDQENATATNGATGRASESLSLLDGSTNSTNGLQKAAIYSVDVHGNRFATGGGDGTVRIWNVGALFQKPKSMIKNKYRRPQASGDANNATINTLTTAATSGNTYESSGESSQEEISPPSSPDSLSHNKTPSSPVRDLSSMVRKKGEAKQHSKATSAPLANSGENDENSTNKITAKHRLVCTLSAHTGSSVLAVRFSNDGTYLASAGDDAVVCVYAKQPQSSNTGAMVARGNLESTSCTLEHWVRIKLCRGHGLDAVGLAWAPDDSHLVSCSLDSKTPIIVWKLTDLTEESASGQKNFYNNVLCNPYKILGKGIHTSTVKGVTFDPAGTYLASSGDDPSVCIWRAHDDWGLEKKIDSKSGIFRKWSTGSNGGASGLSLSSQSLFRRLSWSTDGSYICATNAVVKNKNVASTISREGWAVSSAKSTATGAVNLVGHKQPVVVASHCPYLLDGGSTDADDDDEPEYATLVALGDKRGFVTVWSTRKARPIFKIQCSETRCTVTDLSWGRLPLEGQKSKPPGDLMLLVTLLDGQMVALRFGIPEEFGKLLSEKDQARVFRLRYGIDIHDTSTLGGGRRLFVGDDSGRPKLIENALQFTLEHSYQNQESSDEENDTEERRLQLEQARQKESTMTSDDIRKKQLESRSKGGKKRIQPLLMMQTAPLSPAKKPKLSNGEKKTDKLGNTLEGALELAEKAATGAAAVAAAQKISSQKTGTTNAMQIAAANTGGQQPQTPQPQHHQQTHSVSHQARPNIQLLAGTQSTPQIPHSTDRIHSIDLPLSGTTESSHVIRYVADCTNSTRVPKGSSGSAVPCTVVSISKGGQKLWNDQLLGSTCCAIAASKSWLVVGTSDGSLQIYGTSPTLGWTTANAFRSHPPFVLGRPIVALHLNQKSDNTEMLVVTSDGKFSIYGLKPRLKVLYKGSLLPAMTHMLLSADLETDLYLPKLARIQITETNRLLLLLSLQSATGRHSGAENGGRGGGASLSVGAGGSLQGFIYDRDSELWMRVADSRFVLSDFYNTLPSFSSSSKSSSKRPKGELSKLDDSVRMGATSSTLQRSRKSRSALFGTSTTSMTSGDDGSVNDIASRSHCEDRMACALALGSAAEFEYWFSMYIKILSLTGNESLLRLVMDMLLGKYAKESSSGTPTTCWWLSESPKILGLDRAKLVKTVVIPEMSKNRALQRITNEIAIEAEGFGQE